MRGSRRRLRRSHFPIGPAALRQAAIGSVAALALLPMVVSGSSFAQTAPGTVQVAQDNAQVAQNGQTGAVESIQVTGTRIREPNITATAPVVSVTDQEIKLEGTTNVENLLNNLPSITADQNSSVSNGSDGVATVNLRNLGVNRTLVLIDGKRLGPGDPSGGSGSAADLNFIPAPLVQSVEVLTGGASTDYGSDALAGVVNFKLKRDFEGIEIDQSVGFFQHDQQNGLAEGLLAGNAGGPIATPGNQLDGTNRTSTLIFGANSPNGKGNVTFYATDAHTDPVLQASRDFSDCAIQANTGPVPPKNSFLKCAGSVNSPQGIFIGNVPQNADGTFPTGPGTASFTGGDQFTTNPAGGHSFLNTDNGGQPSFNFNPLNFLQREDQRYTAGGLAHYEVSPYLDAFLDFGFLDDETRAQIAPGGLFLGTGAASVQSGSGFLVNCNNPLLGAQQAASFGCNDPTFVNAQNQVAILAPGLRFAGVPRTTDLDHTDYRFVTGARGDLPYGFNYEAYVSYYKDVFQNETGGFASATKVQDGLLVQTGANGQPVCISGNSTCVPLNIFSRNGAVGAGEQSVLVNSIEVGSATEVIADGSISGDLGRFGVKSPLANDPVSVVAGYEYRTESLVFSPDTENQTGDLLGGGGKILPIAGSIQDQDFFGELHIPVVQDLPFIKAANVDLGIRHTGFNVDGTPDSFDNNTYKVQGDYQIVDDIRLRGGFDRAERNPNTFELFTPNAVALTSGFDDPCSGPTPAASLAACQRTGVTTQQYGKIVDCPAAQCSQLLGGNTTLKPEQADTYTAGFVLTPTEIPNFTFTFDYFQINITNTIADLGIPSSISLAQCIAGPSPLCANIHRGGGGILFGQGAFITATTINAATTFTDGVDFTSSYKHDLDFLELGDVGSVAFNYTGTYTAALSSVPFPGSGSLDCAGLFGVTCGEPMPSYRHEFRTTYLPSFVDAAISLNWRHLSGVDFDGNSSNPLLNQGAFNNVTQHISSFDYFDLSATYEVTNNLQVRGGINNLFDRDPPIVDSNIAGPGGFGNGNTYPGVYDSLGREFFFGATLKF